jgi:long-chain acyl-CoA synthetase
MKTLLVEYLNDFDKRGNQVAFAHRRGLRVHRWTYRQVAAAAFQFAKKIETHGIVKGDRVLLWAENSPEWVASFFGCLLSGAIVVPLDVESTPGFVSRVQQQVEAKLAIVDASTQKQLGVELKVITLREISRTSPRDAAKSMMAAGTVAEDDTVEIVFTSGTTAEPKGVRLTNRNLMSNLIPLEHEIEKYLKWERWVHPIRFLNLLPLSHVFGQFMGLFVPQMLAGEVFFHDSLNPSRLIETVKRERISVIVCVPRMLETLREHVERAEEKSPSPSRFREAIRQAEKWSAVRRWWAFRRVHLRFGLKCWAFISGGATLSAETEEFWRRLGFVVIQGYGMTETASLISVNHPFKQGRGSIGKVMPGQEVKLAANGEILVRGKNVLAGYWKQQEPVVLDKDGWFHTGDVGEFDEEGNLFFKGRKKEVIVTAAGMKVYPDDLEAALNRQPGIKTSVVIPFAGSRGPEPFAVLILRDAEADVQKLIERANQTLAEHQRLRRWYVWPEEDFPRTATSKIRKEAVAERVREFAAKKTAGPRTLGGLEELIARAGGETPDKLEPSASLETDLKLDSLGRVELLSEIEDRYQLEINEAAFNAATTVADLERIIREDQDAKVYEYPYPHWPHRWPVDWLRISLLYLLVFPLTLILGRASVKGIENLRGVFGPHLFIANHLTIVDHALILWALPGRFRRRMSIAMDGEILRDWLKPPPDTGWLTRLRYRVQYLLVALFFNVFSMPHHSGFRRSFSFAGEMIDRGYSVLVFPEGRRSPDGKLQRFKTGIGLLAKNLNVPVVPVRIDGLYEIAREGKHSAPPGAVSVTIGTPIRYSVDDEPDSIAKDLESHLASLVRDTM